MNPDTAEFGFTPMSEDDLTPRGVFCATATPLTDDLAPDHARLVAHCARLLEHGCDGIAPLGTTGEANSFSVAERRGMLDALVDGGIPAARLLPGTGAAALTDAVELTRHAVESGVGAVIVLPPYYYKGISEDGLFAAYAELIERVDHPDLRVVLYHIPQISQIPIHHSVIDKLRERYPAIIAGIKDSSGDLANMEQMVERFPGLAVLSGPDPLLLPLLEAGGAGCITATSNFAARDLAYIYKHYQDPDRRGEVAAAQGRLIVARDATMTHFAHIPSVKAVLALMNNDDSWKTVRPPLIALDDRQASTVNTALHADFALGAHE